MLVRRLFMVGRVVKSEAVRTAGRTGYVFPPGGALIIDRGGAIHGEVLTIV